MTISAVRTADLYRQITGWLINSKLEITWTLSCLGIISSEFACRYWILSRNTCQNSWSSGRDMNPGHTEYEAGRGYSAAKFSDVFFQSQLNVATSSGIKVGWTTKWLPNIKVFDGSRRINSGNSNVKDTTASPHIIRT